VEKKKKWLPLGEKNNVMQMYCYCVVKVKPSLVEDEADDESEGATTYEEM